MDTVSKKTRSRIMAAVKTKNTRSELAVKKLITFLKIRHVSHINTLPGQPDFYLPDYNIAIFVHGCFWHRHSGCKYAMIPKSNRQFWNVKLSENVRRDRRTAKMLRRMGVKVMVIWDCAVRGTLKDKSEISKNKILHKLREELKKPVQKVTICKIVE